MSAITKYKLTFPKTELRIDTNKLTFSINKIKSRVPSVLYFKFYAYDIHDDLIEEYTSSRWVITTSYKLHSETFELETSNPSEIDHYQIELYLLGIDSENPLYMNQLQLNIGDLKDYHTPNEELKEVNIGFNKNHYVNLYNNNDSFLQIIRPNHEGFSTSTLTPSKQTILVPHIPSESNFDNPVAVFHEFMYMTEQIIGVEK